MITDLRYKSSGLLLRNAFKSYSDVTAGVFSGTLLNNVCFGADVFQYVSAGKCGRKFVSVDECFENV